MKSKHIWGPVVSEFAWNLYGNAATLGQNCQFSRLQQTNLLAYMFCLGIKNHHFSATSWCMSNRVSFQNQATDTCCQESRHESLILIGSQNLYFDAFGSLYLSFPKKLRYTIVIYGKIQSYRNWKIQGWSCTIRNSIRILSRILSAENSMRILIRIPRILYYPDTGYYPDTVNLHGYEYKYIHIRIVSAKISG